jgi:hypothetical protein
MDDKVKKPSSVAEAAINEVAFIAWVDAEVDRCWPWLEQAMRRGVPGGIITHGIDDIKKMVFTRQAHLWTTPNGVALTTFSQYPLCRIMNIWLLGGDFEEVFDIHNDAVEHFARSNGARLLYAQGRPGWVRRLRDRGYKECQRIVTKTL